MRLILHALSITFVSIFVSAVHPDESGLGLLHRRQFLHTGPSVDQASGKFLHTEPTIHQPTTGKCPSVTSLKDGPHVLNVDGIERHYITHAPSPRPSDKELSVPRSVLLGFHGFGEGPKEILDQFSFVTSEKDGPLLVALQGKSAKGTPAGWTSGGTVEGVGPDGPTCTPAVYNMYGCDQDTCGADFCKSPPKCMWTTCADDIGFVLAVLDDIKAKFCVDSTRVFAVGLSNGGQFLWDLATNPRSAPHFTAVAPLLGLPHNGFLTAPQVKPPKMLGIWAGVNSKYQDNTVPPFNNLQGDPNESVDFSYSKKGGWYYSTARNTTSFWRTQLNCESGDSDDSSTESLLESEVHGKLTCKSSCEGNFVACLWATNAHDWQPKMARTVWDWFQRSS